MYKNFKEFTRQIKGKRVIIWGIGLNRGGLEAAKYFCHAGARVTAIDLKSRKVLHEALAGLKQYRGIKYIFGRQDEKDFRNADLIIKNPAIAWETPLVRKLLKKDIPIETDISLFFRFFGKNCWRDGKQGKDDHRHAGLSDA